MRPLSSTIFCALISSHNSTLSWNYYSPRVWNWVCASHVFFFRHTERFSSLKLHFRDSKGQLIKTVEANEGDDILSIAHEHDIDLEGTIFIILVILSYQLAHLAGACEGSVACSTCHIILSAEHYDLLPEPEDDENDMLDMAFGLSDTSRLGCQVRLTRELDGMTATLPTATRNMFVDGAMSFCNIESLSHPLCRKKTHSPLAKVTTLHRNDGGATLIQRSS